MAMLGSSEWPAVVRVQTHREAIGIVLGCAYRGWKVLAGVEPDTPRDISDLLQLERVSGTACSRNAACPCGSGRKYKRCCGASRRHAA